MKYVAELRALRNASTTPQSGQAASLLGSSTRQERHCLARLQYAWITHVSQVVQNPIWLRTLALPNLAYGAAVVVADGLPDLHKQTQVTLVWGRHFGMQRSAAHCSAGQDRPVPDNFVQCQVQRPNFTCACHPEHGAVR